MTFIIIGYAISVFLLFLLMMAPVIFIYCFPEDMEAAMSWDDKQFFRKELLNQPGKYLMASVIVSLFWPVLLIRRVFVK